MRATARQDVHGSSRHRRAAFGRFVGEVRVPPAPLTFGRLFGEVALEMRVLVLAGVPFGVVVAGLGSRLAMLVLRLTSPDSVRGVLSDDGFEIGRVTLSGTYNLLGLGATVGVLGAGLYRMVAPWLLGPQWFRHVTVGLGCGAVVGSMLLHSDGIDFHVLTPTWLAMGLFIALPFVFGACIGPVVERVGRPGSWTAEGRHGWVVAAALLIAFPTTLFAFVFVVPLVVVVVAVRDVEPVRRLRAAPAYGLVVRGLWLGTAILGLIALVEDVTAIT